MDAKARRSKLYEYLERNCLAQKGGEFTHTSIYDPMASYYVRPDKIAKFHELYKDAVLSGADLYLTERHRDIGPVVIDLDFRFSYAEGDAVERRYTEDVIVKVVEAYAKVLSEFLGDDAEGEDRVVTEIREETEGRAEDAEDAEGHADNRTDAPMKSFKVYVMEKPSPVLFKGLIKDGIHIVIPDIVTRPVFQLMIRERLLGPLEEVFAGIGLSNPIKDVVDEAVIERNNWQMYGSKKPHLEKYVVTRIYEYVRATGEVRAENVSTNAADHIEVLSIRNKMEETKIKFEKEEDLKKYEELIQARKMRAHFKNSVLSKTRNTQNNRLDSREEFDRISGLVDLLSVARADDYNDWIRVGWCLRNIDHRLLEKWVSFSKKSRKFVAGECEKQWDYMRQDGACLGKGTLHLWAKNDDPERYKVIVQEDLRRLVNNARSGTEYDVALVVQKKYDHNYIYDSRNKVWFVYYNHRWHQTDEGLALKRKLPTEVADEFRSAAAFFQARAADPNTEQDDKERLDELVKKLNDVITKLKRAPFQGCVMTEAAMLFQIDKIDEKMDSNTHLIGFENGVYDLDALEFREGRPEDYITMTTGINYNPHVESNPLVGELNNFLGQVIRVEAVREYVMGLFASFLHGSIREERFHVWTGSGCFAKDTPVLMYDGTTKMIQDVVIGDKLMGDDSTDRNVVELFRGESDMYKIVPIKGDPFVVNGDHDLAVIATNMTFVGKHPQGCSLKWVEYDDEKYMKNVSKVFKTAEERDAFRAKMADDDKVVKKGDKCIVNMRKYFKLPKAIQSFLHIYRTGVEMAEREVPLDPWIFGYWLGDGHSNHSSFTTEDQVVVDYIKEQLDDKCDIHISQANKSDGPANTWSICRKENEDDFCCFAELRKLGVIDNKRIPDIYKRNSRDVRMKVLAGLMDSDGHHQKASNEFEITFKNEDLLDDVIWLARSLGFSCYKYKKFGTWTYKGVKKTGLYYRTYIVGEGIETIPTKITRKMATERTCPRNPNIVNFKVQRVEDDKFYGFELDKNRLFVMGETFTVQKNSNGKSKILELYEKAFGEYCCTLPIALLTQKRGASSSASPELARARTKRFACLQEPGENERLNIGLMKEMTGGDKIYARGLFKEGGEFKPQFKMVLTCNHLPLVPSDDGGTWRRIRVVRFESRFCDHPDPNKPNEFPIDTSLSMHFDDWKEPFMGMLIEYYKRIVTEKIKEPEEVLECTPSTSDATTSSWTFWTTPSKRAKRVSCRSRTRSSSSNRGSRRKASTTRRCARTISKRPSRTSTARRSRRRCSRDGKGTD